MAGGGGRWMDERWWREKKKNKYSKDEQSQEEQEARKLRKCALVKSTKHTCHEHILLQSAEGLE